MIETPIRPLRRRMIEDITVRKFAARTQGRGRRKAIPEPSKALAPSSGRRRTRRAPRIYAATAASGSSSTGPATAAQMAQIDKRASLHRLRHS